MVIVAAPDLACLRNAKNIVDLVRAARPNDPPPRVVLNKVGLPGPARDPGQGLRRGAGHDAVHSSLPFDAKLFGQAANNGQMIDEVGAQVQGGRSLRAAWPG